MALRNRTAGAVTAAVAALALALSLAAGHHASVVSADWYPLPQVLGTVVPRG
ncbi:hypothetical protein ACIQZO_27325 [Streptomyces sp. NPDC097617]|uniref:hypothetical protein n=1 Tax=Streptomyces sp. NPDC097617 TaxID=3366091 RepID=UPI00380C0B3D